jgi:hypothetical protein
MGECIAPTIDADQPVALVPAQASPATIRGWRSSNELRVARRVRNKNVPLGRPGRLDGRRFLTWGVDGTRVILRRIGDFRKTSDSDRAATGAGGRRTARVLHRDLKPANVMLDATATCASPTRHRDGRRGCRRRACGDAAAMAPEQLTGRPASIRRHLCWPGLRGLHGEAHPRERSAT